jgi:hypothetical protein
MGGIKESIAVSYFANPTQRSVLEEILGPGEQSPPTKNQPALVRGLIVDILESGELEVVIPPNDTTRIRCDFLETPANANLDLHAGDLVLLMLPAGAGQIGCVLGRVGRYRAREAQVNEPPSHVVIEAAESLTLKCGESSVGLRKDGKLMIQGTDVLSRAKRCQRIKGGTVAIN